MLPYRVSLISAGIDFQVAVVENKERGGEERKTLRLTPNKSAIRGRGARKLRRRPVTSTKLQQWHVCERYLKCQRTQKIYAEDIKGSRLHTVCSALHCNQLFFSRAVKLILWIRCGLGFYMKAALPCVTNAHCWIGTVHLCSRTLGLYLVKNGCVCAT